MLVFRVSSSLDLNWLLGLAEKEAPISDQSNTESGTLLLLLAIVIVLGLLHLFQFADNREPNPSANEVDQEEQDHPNGELDHDFDGAADQRHSFCAFCGDLSTTVRCSRCKVARYCSMECQSRHWRSGHEYECYESETEGDDHQGRPIHDDGISMLVDKPERESTSDGDGVGVDVSSDSDVNNFNGCEVCGSPTTTSCSRCTLVRYCSTKCLIMNWRLHKDNCIAGEVNSAPAERPNANVGVLENSYEEEENINTSPLYLELHPEGTTNFRSPIKASQDPTKETLVHRTVWMRYLQDEVEKSRKEISILKSERDLWKNRANLTREIYQSIKKQSEDQLFVLKTEKESILNAEKQACNVIHSLHERIKLLQIEVQERISEKRRLEEHTQMVESECAKLKKELQEEHKRAQWFTVESNRNHEIAQIAMREAEAVRRELQGEREHVQRLKENFLRDFRFAESRAAVAEAKLSDLHRRVRLTDYKAPVVTDSLGRPAMACTICLTNEKDLAFGCGHMTCRDCGLKLTKCPICREQITSHIRLFPG